MIALRPDQRAVAEAVLGPLAERRDQQLVAVFSDAGANIGLVYLGVQVRGPVLVVSYHDGVLDQVTDKAAIGGIDRSRNGWRMTELIEAMTVLEGWLPRGWAARPWQLAEMIEIADADVGDAA